MSFKCFNQVQTAFFFLVCFCLLLIQTNKCIERYLQQEKGVTISIQSTTTNTFPSFTICADFYSAYKEDFLRSYNTSSDAFRKGLMPATIDIPLLDFFRKATRNLSEMVDHVNFNYLGSATAAIVTPANDTVWTEQFSVTKGRCYTLTPPTDIVAKEILTVEFHLINWMTYLYAHHPNQFLDPDTHSKIVLFLDQGVFIDMNFELTYLLENLANDSSLVCQNDMNNGYDQCVLNKTAQLQNDEFDCAGIFNTGHYRTCDLPTWNSSEQMRFLNRQQALRDSCCSSPCAGLSFTFGLPDINYNRGNDSSYIKVYFMKNVKVTHQVYTYEADLLVADLGGYSGLLLGFSIYHISLWLQKAIKAITITKIKNEWKTLHLK